MQIKFQVGGTLKLSSVHTKHTNKESVIWFLNPTDFYTKDNVHLLAIDVDDKLIEVAKEKMEEDERSGCAKENITFLALDVMKLNEADNTFKTYLERLRKRRFDIIFCFSVTMWIHLNLGTYMFRIIA